MMINDSKTFTDDQFVVASPENRPFWVAAEKEQFIGKSCSDCGKFHWYPRTVCPFCRSDKTEWTPLSGNGEIYAYSVLRRANPPYVVAYIKLDEGPIVLSNIVDTDENDLKIGLPVQVTFQRTEDGRNSPKFKISKVTR